MLNNKSCRGWLPVFYDWTLDIFDFVVPASAGITLGTHSYLRYPPNLRIIRQYSKYGEYPMEHLSQFIINHWQLSLAFIVVLVLALVNELIAFKKKTKELSPQAVVSLMNNEQSVIIDIRDKESFKNGHIINSINASPEDFSLPKMNKYKGKPIILVCAKGLQAPGLAEKLRLQEFQPMVLSGGVNAWQLADLPLVKKG